ncbi:MAG: SH3 domain-containing protein [Leptospiraceae bacterium]|nr:SH3 domain-containing protein [Leptospiraceae bacterium]
MKKFSPYIILLFLLPIFSISAEKALVNVKSTLVLREKPDKKSKKLGNLPSKAIIETSGTELDSDSNRWFKVTYKGKTGWAFGKFLDFNLGKSKTQTAIGTFVTTEMGDYFHITFKINSEEQSFFVTGSTKGFDVNKFEGNEKKYKGKKYKISWVTEKVYIPEAGGFDTIDNLIKVIPIK